MFSNSAPTKYIDLELRSLALVLHRKNVVSKTCLQQPLRCFPCEILSLVDTTDVSIKWCYSS